MQNDKNNENLDSSKETQADAGSENQATTSAEVSDSQDTGSDETTDVALLETNKKLFERAKKAEAEAKALRAKLAERGDSSDKSSARQSPEPAQNVEEVVLLAQGFPEELLSDLRAIAQVRKTSLIKAQNDPIFVAVKEKFEKKKTEQETGMSASRGASSAKPKRDASTPGLSREEHMEMYKKTYS